MFQMGYGSFEFLVMPMGLTNTPATFQHFMNNIFQDMSDVSVVVYLDDILVYSESENMHCDHIQCIITCLHENNLHVKPEKSLFHTNSINFLGFMVSPKGIAMDSAKTKAISRWPTLSNVKGPVIYWLRQFLLPLYCELLGNHYPSYSPHLKRHQVFVGT